MRIRSIKPEFWRSDDIARLRRDVRLLFVGLWSYVDDNGVGIDDHRQIAADLFALEDDPVAARRFVRDSLATLSDAGLVARYTLDGKAYLFITGWDRHQRVDRPGKPRYPRPDEPGVSVSSGNAGDPNGDATSSRECRESVATGTGEQGNRGTGEQGNLSSALTRADGDPDSLTEEAPVITPGELKAANERPDVTRVCEHLADRIEANGCKRPTIGKRWRDAARLMLDADGRTEAQIIGAIDWCQSDEFWRSNILSMPKLRERYDQLRLAAQRSNGTRASPAAPRPSTTDQRVADALAAGARVQAQLDQQQRLEITA